MALLNRFRVSVKRDFPQHKLAKGMNVEVVLNTTNPLMSMDGKQAIIDAFMRIYGVDLSNKRSYISSGYMDFVKL